VAAEPALLDDGGMNHSRHLDDRDGGDDTVAAIAADSITVAYGELKALDAISIEVCRPGETVVMLGPNGAGKSSFIECVIGYRRPARGTIRVLGSDPWRAEPHWRAQLGVVLQDSRTDADLTTVEYLTMIAGYYGAGKQRVDTVVDAVGLGGHRRRRVHKLSGGQRRRVEIAAALVGDPELVILDEPTSGLDPEARREVWSLIDDLRTRGRTVLMTTHQLDEAESLADRVIVLVDGRVLHNGSVAEFRRLADLPSEVRLDHTNDVTVSMVAHAIAAIAHDSVTVDRDHIAVRAHDPSPVLAALAAQGLTGGLGVHTPRFEDTYFSLVERHRDRPSATSGAPRR